MIRALVFVAFFAVPATVHSAGVIIDTEDQALDYLAGVFSDYECRISRRAFYDQMEIDGVLPTSTATVAASDEAETIMRSRRVLLALDDLFAKGAVYEDPDDPTIAVSKFRGCA